MKIYPDFNRWPSASDALGHRNQAHKFRQQTHTHLFVKFFKDDTIMWLPNNFFYVKWKFSLLLNVYNYEKLIAVRIKQRTYTVLRVTHLHCTRGVDWSSGDSTDLQRNHHTTKNNQDHRWWDQIIVLLQQQTFELFCENFPCSFDIPVRYFSSILKKSYTLIWIVDLFISAKNLSLIFD